MNHHSISSWWQLVLLGAAGAVQATTTLSQGDQHL